MFVVLCWIEPEPPPSNPNGAPVRQYHAVLGCRAGGDIYILDNRTPAIYLWSTSPYPYLWAHQQIAGTTNFRYYLANGTKIAYPRIFDSAILTLPGFSTI